MHFLKVLVLVTLSFITGIILLFILAVIASTSSVFCSASNDPSGIWPKGPLSLASMKLTSSWSIILGINLACKFRLGTKVGH